MKKELKSGILSADKSADCRSTVGGVNVIAVLVVGQNGDTVEQYNTIVKSLFVKVKC